MRIVISASPQNDDRPVQGKESLKHASNHKVENNQNLEKLARNAKESIGGHSSVLAQSEISQINPGITSKNFENYSIDQKVILEAVNASYKAKDLDFRKSMYNNSPM